MTIYHLALWIILTSLTSSITNLLPLLDKTAETLPKNWCTLFKDLEHQQRLLCESTPELLVLVASALGASLAECQYQFKTERWNCPKESFKALSKRGTKESAFIHGVSSAAITYTVTKACSSGRLSFCSCEKVIKKKKPREKGTDPWQHEWQWGGCSDNIRYGLMFNRQFLDTHLRKVALATIDTYPVITLYNNKVGRKAVAQKMQTKCQCHGVSGACAIKTCWRSLAQFAAVGKELKRLYNEVAVKVPKKKHKKFWPAVKSIRKRSLQQWNLVYTEGSPNFCLRHPDIGINGVQDRVCNRSSYGPDGCHSLCCGNGYKTQVVDKTEMCQCKFHWCCHVTCKKCTRRITLSTCR